MRSVREEPEPQSALLLTPALDSQDAWERRMAEGATAFMRFKKEGRYE